MSINFDLSPPLPVMAVSEGWPMPREGRPYHGGVDLRTAVGTPVRAASSGIVVKAGTYTDTPGLAVELAHGDGMLTRYLHLSQLNVATGQRVSQGQLLGLSGFATTAHLHHDAWVEIPKLYEYVQKFGTPTTGFTVTQQFGPIVYVKVPMEPLEPMAYDARVVAADAAANVKLYSTPVLKYVAYATLLATGIWALVEWQQRRRSSGPALPPAGSIG